ncbi:hypothetical protein HK101_005554 [Irineochytrium annulatum]|nr:hypothetical protein HK101_005554 [Irineochytrium annulatum]
MNDMLTASETGVAVDRSTSSPVTASPAQPAPSSPTSPSFMASQFHGRETELGGHLQPSTRILGAPSPVRRTSSTNSNDNSGSSSSDPTAGATATAGADSTLDRVQGTLARNDTLVGYSTTLGRNDTLAIPGQGSTGRHSPGVSDASGTLVRHHTGASTTSNHTPSLQKSVSSASRTSSVSDPNAPFDESASASKFGVKPEEIGKMLESKSADELYALGGVEGLARKLRSSLKNGLSAASDDKLGVYKHRRKNSTMQRNQSMKRGLSTSSSNKGPDRRFSEASEAVPASAGLVVVTPDGSIAPVQSEPSEMTDEGESDMDDEYDDEDFDAGDPKDLMGQQPKDLAKAPTLEDPTAFADRKAHFSDNTLPQPETKSLWSFAFDALKDKTLIVLCVAALMDVAIGIYKSAFAPKKDPLGFVDGVAIIAAVVIIVLISSINDYRKQGQFRKLNDYSRSLAFTQVIRDGQLRKIMTSALLVGDVCLVNVGDILPADGIVIQGFNLSADESSLTGETVAVNKDKMNDPFLLSGTKVVNGVGKMLVVATGPNSVNGRLLASLDVEPEETPLQMKLGRLADQIAKFGLAAAVVMVVGLLIIYFTISTPTKRDAVTYANDIVGVFITGITIVVVAVPEGLPLAVTLSLAHATLRMLKDNNLVRHLKACETMGNATTICSDKTGTLTQNRMTVVAGTLAGVKFDTTNQEPEVQVVIAAEPPAAVVEGPSTANNIDGTTTPPVESGASTPNKKKSAPARLRAGIPKSVLSHVARCININCTADEIANADGKTEFVGSKTEIAMLEFTKSLGFPYAKDREAVEVVEVIPFSSDRKRMSTVVKLPRDGKLEKALYGEAAAKAGHHHHKKDKEQKKWLFCKGAAEIVLTCCDSYLDEGGKVTALTEEKRAAFAECINGMASDALRTICIAFKGYDARSGMGSSGSTARAVRAMPDGISPAAAPLVAEPEGEPQPEEDESGLVLAGLVGIQDPIRTEVPGAVKDCKRAGIIVRMVTGDNLVTARSIAMKAGIIEGPEDETLEGPVFRTLTREQLDDILPRLRVLARSSPLDKQILVQNLKRLGETVAVTGDGTNDAPALRAADVGFSMGIAGTEVAKEASDIVLLDDNFVSLSKAIIWGRSVYDSVRKFLQFQLTVNVTAVFLAVITAFLTGILSYTKEPVSVLSAVQLLWVNLIMDTFAALALATDPPTPDLLDRAPARRTDPLINFDMWKMVLGQSLYQMVVCLGIYLQGSGILKDGWITSGGDYMDSDNVGVDYRTATLVFNTFVFCQVFNEINCRVIGKSLNVFKNVHRNSMFISIVVGTIITQIIIVEFGSTAFKTTKLDGRDWGICLGFGAASLVVGALIRLLPDFIVAPLINPLVKPYKEKPAAAEEDEEDEGDALNRKATWKSWATGASGRGLKDEEEGEAGKGAEATEGKLEGSGVTMAEPDVPIVIVDSNVERPRTASPPPHVPKTKASLPTIAIRTSNQSLGKQSKGGLATEDELSPGSAARRDPKELWQTARKVPRAIGVVTAFRGSRRDWGAAQLKTSRSGAHLKGGAGPSVSAHVTGSGHGLVRDDASFMTTSTVTGMGPR